MAAEESTPSSWWQYVQANLDNQGWTTGDLARHTGIDRSRFTDWRRGRSVSIENARTIARVFGASPLEVMVAAGLLTEQEAQLRRTRPDPAALTDEELLAELGRRLRRADGKV
ncbi:helix-turn-helix domain-containing protein [Saccharothrix coeruleofusca]|uniref:HTH cro/C1-type domain-containing protein n=1 Tax=Saccharothrix coeruleofusca TaxID=33919 RepID=A0A918AJA3_9PSEU|nr:helix-turn-helix transcriptional regulator [Saccharothrix coeruleofusca]MBP2340632.1 transcriptional regulator with XRE-family HTH domain [Saccharothrix coeruleofusca]GGP34189.1 hypothetical protein GCM10010185_00870 [Saccharothrix coeruleofusca]